MDPTTTQAAQQPDAEQSHRTKGLLRLTMACNERCPFCNVPVEDYRRPTPTPEEIARELDAFVESGEQTLVISGGEPTLLRRRLTSLIAEARERGIPLIELQTNAVLIDAEYAAALAEAGLTSAFISLLSHVAEHHDALAGLPGAFTRCIAGIQALLSAGIRVTLNPVTARRTQHLVADYIDFIASDLPGVRSISLSAVQPHGRAAHDPDLLPDYSVLATHIREARARAAHHGIELINPYCGLPLCVGWEDGLDTSVEAIEAATGGWEDKPGIDNQGNKRHGPACRRCALRTRCGGAWHAVWDARSGAGIQPPVAHVLPWIAGSDTAQGQTIIRAQGGLTDAHFRALHEASTPSVWAWTDELSPRDGALLLRAGCTDLALDLDLSAPEDIRPTLKVLRKLTNTANLMSPQRQLRVHLGWAPGEEQAEGVALAHALGTWTLVLRGGQMPSQDTPGMEIVLT
jgi:MoaA/NifB/PqqE/SkfB family radical SAM enzyme